MYSTRSALHDDLVSTTISEVAYSASGENIVNRTEGLSKKQLALSMALKQVEISHGKGAVMQLGSAQAVKVFICISRARPFVQRAPCCQYVYLKIDMDGMHQT